MAFIKEKIDSQSYREHFTATEIDYLKDNKIRKEVLYCLAQISKQLKLSIKKEIINYNFMINNVDSNLFKAIEFIHDRLRVDGFKLEFEEQVYSLDESDKRISIKFIIHHRLNNKYLSHEKLNETIEFYKSQTLSVKETKTIRELAYTDINELIKLLKPIFIEETQYMTRTI